MKLPKISSKQWRYCRIALVLFLVGGYTLCNTFCLQEAFHLMMFQTDHADVSKDESVVAVESIHETASLDENMTSFSSYASSLELVPDTLTPVTFTGCCPKGIGMYAQTCLTEQACTENTLYPFEARIFAKYMHYAYTCEHGESSSQTNK